MLQSFQRPTARKLPLKKDRFQDEARFLRPLYAGDTIRVVATILECRDSKSHPGGGIVTWGLQTFNQKDEEVFKTRLINIMMRRPATP